MALDFVEEAMRTELLSSFGSEVGEAIEEVYRECWDEEIDIFYDGPMMQTFTGPSAGTNASNSSDFRVESSLYDDDLEFTLSVHDAPFSQEEIVDENGYVDREALSDAYSFHGFDYEFDPEAERTRFIQFTPEISGQEPEAFEDRWHVFNEAVEEVMDPDIHVTMNGYDHIYTVPLYDTRQNKENMSNGGRELP
ncbi:MAG: hypothetical protein ABEJ36_01160 [Candidatus Nanosalina sp.]